MKGENIPWSHAALRLIKLGLLLTVTGQNRTGMKLNAVHIIVDSKIARMVWIQVWMVVSLLIECQIDQATRVYPACHPMSAEMPAASLNRINGLDNEWMDLLKVAPQLLMQKLFLSLPC